MDRSTISATAINTLGGAIRSDKLVYKAID